MSRDQADTAWLVVRSIGLVQLSEHSQKLASIDRLAEHAIRSSDSVV